MFPLIQNMLLELTLVYIVKNREFTIFYSYWEYLEWTEIFINHLKSCSIQQHLEAWKSWISDSLHDTASQLLANCKEICTVLSRNSGTRCCQSRWLYYYFKVCTSRCYDVYHTSTLLALWYNFNTTILLKIVSDNAVKL